MKSEQPRLRRLWWFLGLVLLVAIAVLSLIPLRGPVIDVPSSDKLLHAFAYVVLTLYFGELVGDGRLTRVLIGLLMYGIAIELLQTLAPPRSAELADLVANLAGMLIGTLLLRTPLGRGLRLFERLVRR